MRRLSEIQLEEGFGEQVGTRAELGVDDLLAGLEFLCLGLAFKGPVAVVVGQKIMAVAEVEHDGSSWR